MCRCVLSVCLLLVSFSVQAVSVVSIPKAPEVSSELPAFLLSPFGESNTSVAPLVVRRATALVSPEILPRTGLIAVDEIAAFSNVPDDSTVIAIHHTPTALEQAGDPLVYSIVAGTVFGAVMATREWLARTKRSEG